MSKNTPNTSGAIALITKEILKLKNGEDLSLAVACKDSDVRTIRALIIGPPETPYEYGFFEFEVKMSKEYPIKAPHVQCITTNAGRTRFNPNIYAEGKVCLSILGTWRGESGEEWSSVQGLESVLLSIQSLMSSNPYENEPGYENRKKDEDMPKKYIAKIRHEALRIAVVQRLECLLGLPADRLEPSSKRLRLDDGLAVSVKTTSGSSSSDGAVTPATEPSIYEYDAEATYSALDCATWNPFADLMKRRFLWYYDTYTRNVETFIKEQKEGSTFTRMEFEYPPNSMEGTFDYETLRSRLERIKDALDDEVKMWAKEGLRQVDDSTQMATQLAFQFKQLSLIWNDSSYDSSRMELSLPDPSNPFVWRLSLFGKPMTNLDGGIWQLTLAIPPKFPDAQPRVVVDTPIHHHRVSSAGTLCYFPRKEDEISSHLDAIVAAIDDAKPSFDPRAVVNPDAFALYWGGENKRKVYNRNLRRSAQDSCEF